MADFRNMDLAFPSFAKGESTEARLKKIENYLFVVLEQLRYTLENLDLDNFSDQGLQEVGDVITKPLDVELNDPETGLKHRLTVTENGLESEVARAEGAESAIAQTADGIKAQVTDGQGNYTVLNLRSDGLHIGSAAGLTTIDGGNITAHSITLTELGSDVTGSFGDPNPVYIKSTYIDSAEIRSPTIKANAFNVYPDNNSQGSGSFNVYGYPGGTLCHVLKIEYYDGGGVPYVVFSSPGGAPGVTWSFDDTLFDSPVRFYDRVGLRDGYGYGTSLPATGTPGQIFFKI